ncbi:FAD-dependent monooxygenase [Amycolatopsis taiwanensis]|uniref:FAD-dependent monooxygenase n=1 Tax=Amycolatopsis taiwanensis TaxID=342230 RepID=UPI0004B7B7F9|nr:FAD-dependent monooxygenase [Amycolatopsis taiwanensis]
MQTDRQAIIVGGGIGGLAAAIALSRRGWRVSVLERASRITAAGSGLSIWPNGLRALDGLGVGEEVRSRALVDTEGGIRDTRGRWLSKTDTDEMARRHGPLVAIHRADLLEILQATLPPGVVHLGETVSEIAEDNGATTVAHTSGVSRADLVVGADGIHSMVRRALWPQAAAPRYAGYTAWRTVVHPGTRPRSGGETWGSGEIFGIVPLGDGRIYVFAGASTPEGQRSTDGELAELHRRFDSWHDPIPALLDAAEPEAVLRHDIYHLPDLKSFVRQRVALLGDAAHAMTPNLGQGANQALEDAVTLAEVVDHAEPDLALASYDRLRRPRTQSLARQSRRMGSLAHLASPAAALVRNTVMRLAPARVALARLDPVLDWHAPRMTR